MAKTYILRSTEMVSGMYRGWTSGAWGNLYKAGSTALAGMDESGAVMRATNIMFNSSELATLRTKTVLSATLTLHATAGKVPGANNTNTNTALPVGYKLTSDSGQSATGSSSCWTRATDAAASAAGTAAAGYLQEPGSSVGYVDVPSGGKYYNVNVGTDIPVYGYVIGPGVHVDGVEHLVTLEGSATLTVVTNEADASLITYRPDANTIETTVYTDTKQAGVAATLRGATYTRTGYTQTGWSTSPGGAKAYNLGATYSIDAGITLYPFWTAKTFQVKYNANGGTGAPSAQTKTYGQTLTLSSTQPTRQYYIFKGWATSSTATEAQYQPGDSYTANQATTLYAVWEDAGVVAHETTLYVKANGRMIKTNVRGINS